LQCLRPVIATVTQPLPTLTCVRHREGKCSAPSRAQTLGASCRTVWHREDQFHCGAALPASLVARGPQAGLALCHDTSALARGPRLALHISRLYDTVVSRLLRDHAACSRGPAISEAVLVQCNDRAARRSSPANRAGRLRRAAAIHSAPGRHEGLPQAHRGSCRVTQTTDAVSGVLLTPPSPLNPQLPGIAVTEVTACGSGSIRRGVIVAFH